MSRTKKDRREHQIYDVHKVHHKSGVRKQFKRASAKKARRTPIMSAVKTVDVVEKNVKVRIPKNIIRGMNPLVKEIELTIKFEIPTVTYIENYPEGLDPWEFD